MDEAARTAGADDVAIVVDLLLEGRAAIADARGGPMWLRREAMAPPLDVAVRDLIADPDSVVIVATIDTVPLGTVLAVVVEDDHGRITDIRELYVTPEARGVGLGEKLMDALTSWSIERGCAGMTGRALPGDRATKNYFETFGLVARSIEVYRAFDRS